MKISSKRSAIACLVSWILLYSVVGVYSITGDSQKLRQRFATDTDIPALNWQLYQQAVAAKDAAQLEEAFLLLNRITNLNARDEYILLYIELLYLSGSYDEVNIFIDKMPLSTKNRLFDQLIEYYLVSALNIERYDRISAFIELQREYYPNQIHSIYKKTLYSLLRNGQDQHVIFLTDIYPSNIYLEGEKNFILGVAYYNTQYYRSSLAFMQNVLASHNDLLQTAAYDYLSMIAYHLKAPGVLPEFSDSFSQEAKFNTILTLLELGMIDEASSLAIELNNSHCPLVELFLAWESGHYKTVSTILNTLEQGDPDRSPLLTMINAEILYHTKQYRQAEAKFRKYLTFNRIDEQYANHALGFCFYGYYRFNSTAYYWMKNLTTGKSYYDSLAVYNLAQLYTQTENFNTARHYFASYKDKYQVPLTDERFVVNFLLVLNKTGDFKQYESFFDRYGDALPVTEQVKIINKIGDHYHRTNQLKKALDYYNRSLELKLDYSLILKRESVRFNLGEYNDSEEFVLTLLEEYPESNHNVRLAQDLTKYYLNQKQYRKALNFITDFLQDQQHTISTDTLFYYSGLAHKELKDSEQALDTFISLHQKTKIASLRRLTVQEMEQLLIEQEPRSSITLLVNILEDLQDDELGFDYLRILAKVYEAAYLYPEANEIYQILLEQDQQSEREELYYLLAVNEVYQKNYGAALNSLVIILSNEESPYFADALFLSYLANYSLDKHYKALSILLSIYYEHSQSPPKFEIVRNLIELLVEMDLKLFAWYYIGQYYPYSTRREEYTLQRYGDHLIMNLGEDVQQLRQIMDMRTFIDLTLTVLEKYED